MLKENQTILEDHLRLYKQFKAEVATTLERIKVWQDTLKQGDLWLFENSVNKILGMPVARSTNSPTERIAENREVAAELVQDWIEEDKSRIHFKKVEVDQIDGAMSALSEKQRTIIECKYFEGMFWRNIEIVYNEKYSNGVVYTGEEMLRKINREALEILWEILGPWFQRYLYFRRL